MLFLCLQRFYFIPQYSKLSLSMFQYNMTLKFFFMKPRNGTNKSCTWWVATRLSVTVNNNRCFQQIISYDSPRGGVSVVTEKGETTTSFLLIQQARPSDSGTYQCNPSNAQSKSIVVHVLNGEYLQPSGIKRNIPHWFYFCHCHFTHYARSTL